MNLIIKRKINPGEDLSSVTDSQLIKNYLFFYIGETKSMSFFS